MIDAGQDTVENYKGCVIQHGHYNARIYLIKITSLPSPGFPRELIEMAKINGYSKIFAKVPESLAKDFSITGFRKEAGVPGFFAGKEAAVFLGYYLSTERFKEKDGNKLSEILQMTLRRKQEDKLPELDKKFIVRKCGRSDTTAMAKIYKEVFTSYPFPIHNPDYLLETMQSHTDYFGVETGGTLVALSSSEKDNAGANAEMTDFATLPRWRGNHLGQYLLAQMEIEMKRKGIITAYTIARAMSPGMNITFRKAGYKYGGRLKNNTNISGKIESMNVWFKKFV
ncbi:MAG: putative beta-lysine N-acetyltransferase [Elusimicrobiota bacterium]|nr:putative beta-lysine N-acetyltransferase [Elusimicrobiota bacterium]